MAILCSIDLIQALFDPVVFTQSTDQADEMRTYMMFTQFLTEAEGMYRPKLLLFVFLSISNI